MILFNGLVEVEDQGDSTVYGNDSGMRVKMTPVVKGDSYAMQIAVEDEGRQGGPVKWDWRGQKGVGVTGGRYEVALRPHKSGGTVDLAYVVDREHVPLAAIYPKSGNDADIVRELKEVAEQRELTMMFLSGCLDEAEGDLVDRCREAAVQEAGRVWQVIVAGEAEESDQAFLDKVVAKAQAVGLDIELPNAAAPAI